ncbi:MAG: hypothetical protein U1F25_00295 [Rubrivivax sp.]
MYRSYYSDDGTCARQLIDREIRARYQGQNLVVVAPDEVKSPRSETRRVGTPLQINPAEAFVVGLRQAGAEVLEQGQVADTSGARRIRLVVVSHDRTNTGPGSFFAETTIAVRVCEVGAHEFSRVRIGRLKGVEVIDFWGASFASKKWKAAFREAFQQSVNESIQSSLASN